MSSTSLLIPATEMNSKLYDVLIRHDFQDRKAKICADTFTTNSLDGVYTHGINRFAKFVSYVRKGLIKHGNDPQRVNGAGALEHWDGHSGIGITNAFACTARTMELAEASGIGCVAIANTNHWMRAGTYARRMAANGYAGICWSNTIQNTAAWGALDPRLGNNPLAIAVPYGDDAVVLDMAMSQYSYGSLDQYRMKGEKLPVPGGFDEQGNLSVDPGAILNSRRTMPIGYWKGSGLSLLLDILATILSGGLSVSQISKQQEETRVSQVFIAINLKRLEHHSRIPDLIDEIIRDYHGSTPVEQGRKIRYPGERILRVRNENQSNGIPVLRNVWDEILLL